MCSISQDGDARSLALLATDIIEQVKINDISHAHQHQQQEEAIELATRSIQLSPNDSIGYAVLSTIPLVKFEERMTSLQKAISIEQQQRKKTVKSCVAIATSLKRLLIEPREEMARGKDKLTTKSIMRADLSINSLTGLDEHSIYKDLNSALDEAKNLIWNRREEKWKTDPLSASFSSIPHSIHCLVYVHYRLGTIFRTMLPKTQRHSSKSRHHFQSVLDLLNPPHMDESFDIQSQPDLYDLELKSKFWLGTLNDDNNESAVDRCPSNYIVDLYSTFAATFDDQLVNKLHYQTPTKLRKLVDEVVKQSYQAECFNNLADLGCGTGLSGMAFQSLATNMIGVDLSPEMIAKAEKRGCYKSLHIGDIESILTSPISTGEEAFDMIIACDVFVYIGDLQSVFESVAKCLNPTHGLFAFSTELLEEDKKDNGYTLQTTARFAHKESYLKCLSEECGFVVTAMKNDVIRKNAGKDIHGTLTILSIK